jgi:hypothetical protein
MSRLLGALFGLLLLMGMALCTFAERLAPLPQDDCFLLLWPSFKSTLTPDRVVQMCRDIAERARRETERTP